MIYMHDVEIVNRCNITRLKYCLNELWNVRVCKRDNDNNIYNKELQTTAMLGAAHILREVLM
jgi:hypothetical protein